MDKTFILCTHKHNKFLANLTLFWNGSERNTPTSGQHIGINPSSIIESDTSNTNKGKIQLLQMTLNLVKSENNQISVTNKKFIKFPGFNINANLLQYNNTLTSRKYFKKIIWSLLLVSNSNRNLRFKVKFIWIKYFGSIVFYFITALRKVT